jgi:type VI secretion system protein ImpA
VLQGESGKPDWKPVIEMSREALISHSKDLQIASWLTEALVRTGGFAGLNCGIRVMSGLVEKFWDTLYPLPDDEGISSRVAPITGLNGEDGEGVLIYPINNLPIIPAEAAAYGLSAYQQARSVAQIADEEVRQNRISRGAVSIEMLQAAAVSAPPEFVASLRENIGQCLASWDELSKLLAEKCGKDAPPASKIRELLVEAKEMMTRFYPSSGPEPAAEQEATGASEPQTGAAKAAAPVVAGAIASREQAFGTLQKVAAFFKKTEPHSPISYALEQAVRWGQMPLPQLLIELIPEDSTRNNVYKLIGIPQEKQE